MGCESPQASQSYCTRPGKGARFISNCCPGSLVVQLIMVEFNTGIGVWGSWANWGVGNGRKILGVPDLSPGRCCQRMVETWVVCQMERVAAVCGGHNGPFELDDIADDPGR